MQLRPVSEPCPTAYPARLPVRRPGTFEIVRKAVAAACASGALLLGACYGSTPLDGGEGGEWTGGELGRVPTLRVVEPPPLPPEPEPMPGDVAAPGFTCGSLQEWSIAWAPGWIEGSLCGDEIAYGGLEVSASGRHVVRIVSGAEHALVAVVDPAGEEVAQVGGEAPQIEVDLTVGRWTFEATPVDPVANPYAWISLTIEPLND